MTEGATTLRAFTYDAAGNPTRDTRSGVDTDYTYDDAGRLRTVTVAGSPKATYTYDGLERLAIRTLTNQTPSGTTHFIHMLGGGGAFDELAPGLGEQFGGPGNRIIGETDGAGNLVREYVWLDDLIIAVVSDANTASPQIWWVTNDHLGRPVQMTDWSKTVVWRASHRPFGEVTAVTGTASLDARFPGQWFQLESGLAYNWHRHYDASLGRYTQPDPLGVKAGPSVYGYAGGNPVMAVDPDGRCPWCIIGAGMGFLVAALYPDYANAPGPSDKVFENDPLAPYSAGGVAACSIAKSPGALRTAVRLWRDESGGIKFGSNVRENKMAKDALEQAARENGRPISDDLRRQWHDHISGQGINGYNNLLQEARDFLSYW